MNTFHNPYFFYQIYVFDPVPDPNISTFRPLDQAVNSNIRYNGNGYLPCNGFVPCQVVTPFICPPFLIIEENMKSLLRNKMFCFSLTSCPQHSWKSGWRRLDLAIITRDREQTLRGAGDLAYCQRFS